MAEGGDGRDENPFSFKKFIKSKSKDLVTNSDDEESDEEENAVDLLENSCGQNKGDGLHGSNRKSDENPFSFKRFLQAASGNSGHSRGMNGAGIATLDLANDLPDFVQDHYHGADRLDHHSTVSSIAGRSRQPVVDQPLPDFALDATDQRPGCASWALSPESSPTEGSSSLLWQFQGQGGSRGSASGTECLELRAHEPRPLLPSVAGASLHRHEDSGINIALDAAHMDVVETSDIVLPRSDTRHRTSGLPDFLSDSALGAAVNGSDLLCTGTSDVCAAAASNGLSNHCVEMNCVPDGKQLRLQEENQRLQSQLRETQDLLRREKLRADEAVRQMELKQKRELDETAALERMVQQVEANLESTTQRALLAESTVAKLKQDVKVLQARVETLEAENVVWRSTSSESNCVLRDRALYASQQLEIGATDAEKLLKDLLAGVEKLRIISSVLASTDKVTEGSNHSQGASSNSSS